MWQVFQVRPRTPRAPCPTPWPGLSGRAPRQGPPLPGVRAFLPHDSARGCPLGARVPPTPSRRAVAPRPGGGFSLP
eukprot:7312738-Alexandrium_andersonii.AAC.1